ncbi:MAG: translation initiation factor IF-2 [Bacteroidia bacterium]|nr:translation initiation factor IF-2 [Bacteroidia bacterium]
MTESTQYRISKVVKDLNISIDHIVDALKAQGIQVERNPNAKITQEHFDILLKQFSQDKAIKEESDNLAKQKVNQDMVHDLKGRDTTIETAADEEEINLDKLKKEVADKTAKAKKEEKEKAKAEEEAKQPEPEVVTPVEIIPEPVIEPADDVIRAKVDKKEGPTVLGSITLPVSDKGTKGRKKKDAETTSEAEEPKKAKTTKKTKEVAETPIEQVVSEAVPVEVKPIEPEKAETVTPPKPEEIETIKVQTQKLSGPNIVGRIELPTADNKRKPAASSSQSINDNKKKRKRTDKRVSSSSNPLQNQGEAKAGFQRDNKPKDQRDRKPFQQPNKNEPTDKEIQDQIKATLQKLSGGGGKSKGSKIRREKRNLAAERIENAEMADAANKKIKVTEFVTANELAKLLNVSVTQIISTCMSLGMFVSINQRLDAETLALVAEEFGYEIEFVSAEVQEAINDTPDAEADLKPRPPIVTVMGHVDHGKTSLLDYVRSANVIAGEAGGITQHIGAYEVTLSENRKITFLDTPGHEAFTAMRARGAKITDVAIIVIAADDSVMPQTIEAINHAQAAGVPIVFAFNKMDKPDAAPDRVREQLSKMNILVEEWGGKFQTQEISAKKGLNIDKLLDKVLLEAEILDLKANPSRNAKGTVIEATLDKGRGYVTTMLVQTGTIKTGDVLLAGCHSGRVKAMFNERGIRMEEAGPSTPVMLLGLSGAPQAGDQFNVMEDEREARDIANKRLQLQREQGLRTHKHITLDEIGRRLAIGNFKELNVIVKGDVDGSVEALADSLLKLSTEEIQVNVIHKSVGQISESDVLLASASNAIIIGFQVRPSVNARKLAENEQIDIRLYSIIYKAIEEIKAAMEGMLAPEFEEKIVCNIEIRETFKIPKVGTIAGCMVLDGKITRNTKVRVVRDGIVTYSGELASLKRFKDDVKEVNAGYECGLNIANFNDIQIGDIVEGYEQVAVKRTLA